MTAVGEKGVYKLAHEYDAQGVFTEKEGKGWGEAAFFIIEK